MIQKLPAIETSPAAIERTPGVCGGAACLHGTRIPVWLLIRYRRLGAGDAELLNCFPSIQAADLAAAWEYADDFPEEIAAAIAEQEAADVRLCA